MRSSAEPPITFAGNRGAALLLRLAGWTLRFDGLPARQGVIVVYPHTSNWDFVVGLLAKWATGVPVHFWGKDSLFRIPLFGRWMRAVGGIPVDRHAPQGVVETTVQRVAAARERGELFWLALSPEGTRGYRDHWRSGFYRVALAARVPVGIATLDWGRHEIDIRRFVDLSGDPVADLARIAVHLQGVRGRRPERAAPVTLASR
ncbi:MAG TPA: 1-acyl-sn-glycerol-3-phosphate acyltransferase [Methylibium sp.]|nr:1-acyl-sn-glycerol-3-phosphate acyltransferase [Methylibium sp.]